MEKKEKEKSNEQDFIKIESEDLTLNIRRNEQRIKEAINLLKTFIKDFDEDEEIEEESEVEESYEDEGDIIEIDTGFKKPELPKIKPLLNRQLPPISQPTPQPQETENLMRKEIVALNPPQKFDKCPLCNGKLKRKKVVQHDDVLTQVIFCKNKKCSFEREYVINI